MLKQHKICVIAGLSGVGKSHLIKQLKQNNDYYINFSAGELIKERRSNIGHDELRLLPSDEILRNQYLLVDQFQRELNAIQEKVLVLFDAHMIIDTDNSLFEVPLDIFSRLSPSYLIHISEKPETILSRRLSDISRIRPPRTPEELREQQKRSLDLARIYSDKLHIEFADISSSDIEALRKQFCLWCI